MGLPRRPLTPPRPRPAVVVLEGVVLPLRRPVAALHQRPEEVVGTTDPPRRPLTPPRCHRLAVVVEGIVLLLLHLVTPLHRHLEVVMEGVALPLRRPVAPLLKV